MLPVQLLEKSDVLRKLMPQDLMLEVDQFSSSQTAKGAKYLAYVAGIAHARQMEPGAVRSEERV